MLGKIVVGVKRRFRMERWMSRRRMREKDAIVLAGLLGLVILLIASPFWGPMIWNGTDVAQVPQAVSGSAGKREEDEKKEPVVLPVIDETGLTLQERINPPNGYERAKAKKGSFAEFLRGYGLKKSTGVVKTWDGKKRSGQTGVQAVFKLPLAKENLQWAAGTVIRVYAEYFYTTGQFDRMSFQLRDGFAADFSKWQEGYRIRMDATGAIWVNGGVSDTSRENYEKYIHSVLLYTSASSLEKETEKVKKTDIQVGDIFLQTGTEADAAIVVDMCENEAGQKAFLLAKGGKPAEQFHLLKNPAHEDDPWYYVEEMKYPFKTPEGTFEKGTLRRPSYMD